MASISLCMIVKDEERFLPDCLASARGAVDEIIVVDTGSSDRTVEIAEHAGAAVVHFAWHDDFSAARNAGLAAARGTHILVLDADERLAGHALLRKAAEDRSLLIGMLPLHDADALDAQPADVVSGARRLSDPVWVPRFFRNDPWLRYRRRVHETLFTDIGDIVAKLGGRIAPVESPIAHYGGVKSLRADLGKSARNTRLLEIALGEDPGDGDLAGYLAMEYARAGDLERAHAIGQRHLPAFLERLDAFGTDVLKPSPIQLASVLATCQLQRGEPHLALAVVHESARRCLEPHPNLVFLEGAALEALGRFDEAERAFRECLAMDGRRFTIPVNPGATGPAPRLRLANILVLRGRAREALDVLSGPGADPIGGRFAPAANLIRAEAHLHMKEPVQALPFLVPLMRAKDPPPDMFALAAWASALGGQRDEALLDAARRAPRERWIEVRRRALVDEASAPPRDEVRALRRDESNAHQGDPSA